MVSDSKRYVLVLATGAGGEYGRKLRSRSGPSGDRAQMLGEKEPGSGPCKSPHKATCQRPWSTYLGAMTHREKLSNER